MAGYTEGGAYLLIYGFDPYNISVYDPASGSTFKMGLNDSEAYFKSFGNDFICVFKGINRCCALQMRLLCYN